MYVDDVILAGDGAAEIKSIKHLHDKFTVRNLGKLRYMLRLEMAQSDKAIVLTQRKYALDLL